MKKEKYITLAICCIFIIIAGVLYVNSNRSESSSDLLLTSSAAPTAISDTTATDTADSTASEHIAVYICGAVVHPGVYDFDSDARVCDAISAAGGFGKNASKTSINQARFLADGEQITIPTKKQARHNTSVGSNTSSSDNINQTADNGLININQADETTLMTLSGIGESKAAAITTYRSEQGSFSSIEDIMKVPGIKEGVYNQIKDKITI